MSPLPFTAVGGSSHPAAIGQFPWLKAEFNSKALAQDVPQSGNPNEYGGSVLDDSDNAQRRLPSISSRSRSSCTSSFNLKAAASQNFVILFGGTLGARTHSGR